MRNTHVDTFPSLRGAMCHCGHNFSFEHSTNVLPSSTEREERCLQRYLLKLASSHCTSWIQVSLFYRTKRSSVASLTHPLKHHLGLSFPQSHLTWSKSILRVMGALFSVCSQSHSPHETCCRSPLYLCHQTGLLWAQTPCPASFLVSSCRAQLSWSRSNSVIRGCCLSRLHLAVGPLKDTIAPENKK